LKLVIDTRNSSGQEPAIKIIANGDGKRAMDQARRLVAELDRDALALLDRRRDEAESSALLAKAVMLWGSVGGSVLVGLIGLFIPRPVSSQIVTAGTQVRSSAAELQSAANQQATGAKEQATAMSEITTTITELLATSRQIAESAQRVSQIAERAA